MSKVYVLRGRKIPKTVSDEAYDPIYCTFSEVYSEYNAAIGALKKHLEDSIEDIRDAIHGATLDSLLTNGASDIYSWYYTEHGDCDVGNPAAEWVLSTESCKRCREPILPFFVIDVCELK